MGKKFIRLMLDALFILGLASFTVGATVITPALGWITGGLCLVVISIMAKLGGGGT